MIYVGNMVSTHGIKGEIRLISNVKHKDLVFKKGNQIKIGDDYLIINSYRIHKNFDMLTFSDINNINDVLKYKGKKVYFDKNQITDVLFDEDYIGLEVYSNRYIGIVIDVMNNSKQDILVVKNDKSKYFIPNVSEFVKSIDIADKKIYINEIDGLLDEN